MASANSEYRLRQICEIGLVIDFLRHNEGKPHTIDGLYSLVHAYTHQQRFSICTKLPRAERVIPVRIVHVRIGRRYVLHRCPYLSSLL